MAETAWSAGFSRHALRDGAAHGATSTCDMVPRVPLTSGMASAAGCAVRSGRPYALAALRAACRLKPALQAAGAIVLHRGFAVVARLHFHSNGA